MAKVHRRRVAGWIAIFAILLNMFAPAASHAFGGSAVPPWLELCTASGPDASDAQRRQSDAPAKPGAAKFQHCPYCAPHGASFGAPPASAKLAAASDIGPQRVAVAEAAVPVRPVWRAARPRGPPVL